MGYHGILGSKSPCFFFETKNWMNFQCEKETWLGDPTARVVMIFWGESS